MSEPIRRRMSIGPLATELTTRPSGEVSADNLEAGIRELQTAAKGVASSDELFDRLLSIIDLGKDQKEDPKGH